MTHYTGPLLTRPLADALRAARNADATDVSASFDLGRTQEVATLEADGWHWHDRRYPWPDGLKERTVYFWNGTEFAPLQRYAGSLIKLVPTDWGAPTFEIDGIKMLVSERIAPMDDARRKVALVQPRGKQVLDTCGGLGYFAACCLAEGAARIHSFEKNRDVLWLRAHNPWSPDPDSAEAGGRLNLLHGDVAEQIQTLPDQSVDAVLHDPPRFGIAGELYAQSFYEELARVLRPGGRLFHYTGAPNRKTSGRDVPSEVLRRLTKSGFSAEPALDGVFATKSAPRATRR